MGAGIAFSSETTEEKKGKAYERMIFNTLDIKQQRTGILRDGNVWGESYDCLSFQPQENLRARARRSSLEASLSWEEAESGKRGSWCSQGSCVWEEGPQRLVSGGLQSIPTEHLVESCSEHAREEAPQVQGRPSEGMRGRSERHSHQAKWMPAPSTGL